MSAAVLAKRAALLALRGNRGRAMQLLLDAGLDYRAAIAALNPTGAA